MNNYRDIIIAPIVTEKTAACANENKVVFKVDLKANKTQIYTNNLYKLINPFILLHYCICIP